MNNYEDIINLEHHVSKTRPQMSLYNRAAQFAPYSALTGYEEEIKETARQTSKEIYLDESSKNIINSKLSYLKNHILEQIEVEIIYFVKDKKKQGGEYKTYKGIIRRIDEANELIYFIDKTKLEFKNIIDIKSELL